MKEYSGHTIITVNFIKNLFWSKWAICPSPLSCQAPFKFANCPWPTLQAISPLYWFFVNSHPLIVGFFRARPKYQSFSSLTPSFLLKVPKFLVKISQFKFLVMTEKTIFVYKPFFVIKYFRLQFVFFGFFCKIATPLKKVTPSFPATPL